MGWIEREAIQADSSTGQMLTSAEKKEVILRHLSDIADMRTLAMELLDEQRSKMEQLIEPVHDGTKKRGCRRAAQSSRCEASDSVKRKPRATSLHKLNDILTKLRMLERKALGQSDMCYDARNANRKVNQRYARAVVADSVVGVGTPLEGCSA